MPKTLSKAKQPPATSTAVAKKFQQDKKARNQAKFLKAFERSGTLCSSADKCGLDRNCHYNWLKDDPTYEARFNEARAAHNEAIEEEIHRRGVNGISEDVYYSGKKVGERKVYSDVLLMFYAKGAMAKYQKTDQVEHTGKIAIELLKEDESL